MKRELIRPTAKHVSTLLIFAKRFSTQLSSWLLVFAVMLGTLAIPPSARAQTLTILDSLGGLIGAQPRVGLTRDSAGNLYGTTSSGGVPACDQNVGGGTVFKVDARGRITLVHAFANGTDGCFPTSPLIRDSAGNLYGTNLDIVFKISAAGDLAVLHHFTGQRDGSYPAGSLLLDGQGNLFGVTSRGGKFGAGLAYRLDASGNETILHFFSGGSGGPDGALPAGGLVRDSLGNFYGTTAGGGANGCPSGLGCGTVFRLEINGTVTILYNFTSGADGNSPNAGLIRDSHGNLYGTTSYGGDFTCDFLGCGTVFKLDRSGKLTVLHTFAGPEGARPSDGLVMDSSGNLYGTATLGGVSTCYCGVVYKVDGTGNLTVLHAFNGSPDDGYLPIGALVRDPAGNLFGTTYNGGTGNEGAVFKLTP